MEKRGLYLHGMPTGYVDAVSGDALQAFLDDLFSGWRSSITDLQMLHLAHPILDQPGMAQFLYRLAAMYLIQGIVDTSKNDTPLWKVFGAAIYTDKCEKPSPTDQRCQLIGKAVRVQWYFVKHIGSLKDIVVYLDKKVPCDCLGGVKKVALEVEEDRHCDQCRRYTKNAMWCSECIMAEYCSKECQIAHWPKHRIQCDLFCGKITAAEFERLLGEL
ncbi:expressed unknown protein [Seminavis robusta]|uniref:MYND-type domain-containing protein n=1 Tax=Seminavis robusta TaxID=568900 RepID=A0A9N8E0E6_9STRA|nr:expressed unknown protein [Seminavis robusta]|eukprot:Sro411_g137600.1 n/a (216) ;mRNA; f:20298-20945